MEQTVATTVLLVENDPVDAELIRGALAGPEAGLFRVEWVTRLDEALERLEREDFDVVLLDLSLPDGQGIEAFDRVLRATPNALILVLSAASDEETARRAVQLGAQDYLAKEHADAYWLPRALRYVTERKSTERVLRTAEETLFAEKERARVMLESIGDAVLATDLQGNVTYLNPVAEEMTGWSCEEALGRTLEEVFNIIDGTTREVASNPALRAIEQDQTVGLAMDCVLIRRDGIETAIEDSAAPIHDRDGKVCGAVIVFHDGSQSRAITEKMAYMAHHDVLTGLPNRLLLTERLDRMIGLAERHHTQLALLFLDLDNFKNINDALGHQVGDLLLKSVAGRLAACVRASDTVCRQGGDEFVILLAEVEQPHDASRVAEMLRASLAVPHFVDGHEIHVNLSIGISLYPRDGESVETLMQNADLAMFHAKANGRGTHHFFRSEMNSRALERMVVEGGLRRALKQEEFLLHYQPQIGLDSGAMVGAEVLIRWKHPELGLTYPAYFIAIAEACGLIVPIGQWVLREVFRQVQAWRDAGLSAVPVAVNISAVELQDKRFVEALALLLEETGLPPSYLELEVTESHLMKDSTASELTLATIREMGVRLAIDDFGSGYSSLSYLKRFSFDTLKIDRSFMQDIVSGENDTSLISAVIGIGQTLRQRVIAEGVETQEQLAFLRTRQCSVGQGFLFSHPLPAEDFERVLAGRDDPLSRHWPQPRPARAQQGISRARRFN